MAPVFSLVWDEDVSAKTAMTFPELYKDLMKVYSQRVHTHNTHTHTSTCTHVHTHNTHVHNTHTNIYIHTHTYLLIIYFMFDTLFNVGTVTIIQDLFHLDIDKLISRYLLVT